jgi:PilZ domain
MCGILLPRTRDCKPRRRRAREFLSPRGLDLCHNAVQAASLMEKRRFARVKVSMQIDWGTNGHCHWHDRLTSLSVGGCFIQTARGLETGQRVYVCFWLGALGRTLLRGEVRYCLERVGCGVEFVGLMEREKDQLSSLVQHYRDAPPGG